MHRGRPHGAPQARSGVSGRQGLCEYRKSHGETGGGGSNRGGRRPQSAEAGPGCPFPKGHSVTQGHQEGEVRVQTGGPGLRPRSGVSRRGPHGHRPGNVQRSGRGLEGGVGRAPGTGTGPEPASLAEGTDGVWKDVRLGGLGGGGMRSQEGQGSAQGVHRTM